MDERIGVAIAALLLGCAAPAALSSPPGPAAAAPAPVVEVPPPPTASAEVTPEPPEPPSHPDDEEPPADPPTELGMIGLTGTSQVGDSFGVGGLAVMGTGPGSGDWGEGIGTIGTLGHGAGTGGQGRVGGRRTPAPRVWMGAVGVGGRLPPEVIARVIRMSFGRFRLCYENGLKRVPKLEGRVGVDFTIGRDGAVTAAARNDATTLPDQAVVDCVVQAIASVRFPQPDAGVVKVSLPFNFAPPDP